jgi:mono/diheme cytochrome c family protein
MRGSPHLLCRLIPVVLAPVAAARADFGQALFRGLAESPAVARIGSGGVQAPAGRFACSTCHGRDARGGREGAAPAPSIDGRDLTAETAHRPAYTLESFRRAIVDGIAPGGNRLSSAMPRFTFGPGETAALFDYLGRIGAEQRTGIDPDWVRFAVTAPPHRLAAAEAIVAAFEQAWRDLGDPQPHGRRPQLSIVETGAIVDPTVMARINAFALLLVIPDASKDVLTRATDAGVPVVLPFTQPQGSESPDDLRAAFTSVTDEIAAALEAAGPDAAIVADGTTPARFRLPAGRRRMSIADFIAASPHPATILLLADDQSLRDIAREDLNGITIYRRAADVVRVPSDRLRAAGATVFMTVPYDLKDGVERLRVADLARVAAAAVHNALSAAGRDLTRCGFMRAFDGVRFEGEIWPTLNYRKHPVSGTAAVRIVPAP